MSVAFDRILVAFDGSAPARAALADAVALGGDGRRVTAVIVIQTGDLLDKAATYGYDPTPFLEELRNAADATLAWAKRYAAEHDVPLRTKRLEGDPIDALLEAARDADLVVVGTHARTGLPRMLIGSVAEALIRRSPIPVLVARAEQVPPGGGSRPLQPGVSL